MSHSDRAAFGISPRILCCARCPSVVDNIVGFRQTWLQFLCSEYHTGVDVSHTLLLHPYDMVMRGTYIER